MAARSQFFAMVVLSLLLHSCSASKQDAGSIEPELPGSRLAKYGIVIPVGPNGSWDSGMVESPVVWFDSLQGKYGMVYTGYASLDSTKKGYKHVAKPQVGLAWSADLLHWVKDPKSPIFGGSGIAGSSDEEGTSGPFMWMENRTYTLFYFGVTGKGYEKGLKTMNLATSSDLYTWRRYSGNPIIAPSGNGWRRDAIWHPNVVKNNDQYFLFFNASGLYNGLAEEFIGYATSSDLFHWTVDDAHSPILVGSHIPGRWDASGRAGDPSVFKAGTIWCMAWYSWDNKNSADGLAWTTEFKFPLGWQRYDRNPVLSVGLPGSYDALHAGKPFIVRTPERHFHFYTAVALDETRQIALAVWPPVR